MPLPTPSQISSIADAGGWLFASLVLFLVILALIRGDLVPGWIHKRETDRADKTTEAVEQQTDALEKQTGVIAALSKQVETLVTLLSPTVRAGRG